MMRVYGALQVIQMDQWNGFNVWGELYILVTRIIWNHFDATYFLTL